ncbi:helix-turn-helix domain-containing protein [Mobilicoccus pelagius]|uniref:Putative transcriptional regulator n=1 Tax=Mobilicoccus pelagius NBRC 104925 TaxID=1089455 RepID=H5UVJ2_9MICO|nr:helix-turn-helix transcriptional regulator [Mobilicoccus pelagius]GAB49750.1 putative transcriptional regulator [Mobilicoccus pelagius NBRC 104925]
MTDSSTGRAVERLGARIRAERQERGLTIAELSERSGVGRGTVTDLERTLRTPSLDTLAKIAAGLGVPVPDLLRDRVSGGRCRLTSVPGLEVEVLDVWTEGDVQVEIHRVRITDTVRRPAARTGTRGYLTLVAGVLSAGSASTPRKIETGGQVAYAADQPHVFVPIGGPAEAVLVMRHPIEREDAGASEAGTGEGQPGSS